jgi:hypothetical protein
MVRKARRRSTGGARVIALSLGMLALGACGGPLQGSDTSPSPSPGAKALQAVIVSSFTSDGPCGSVPCLTVGPNQRVGFFMQDSKSQLVADASVSAQVFTLPPGGARPSPLGQAQTAHFHGRELEEAGAQRGVYSISVPITVVGQYRLVVTATKDTVSATSDALFLVLAADAGVAIGAAAPKSQNPTLAQVPDVSTIDTGNPPDDMHYTSISDAIAKHHPLVIYMGTPGFCTSRTCAPEVNAVKAVESTYRSRGVDFVHIETYKGGRPDNADVSKATLSPTFIEWKLTTEPWVILVDKNGNVATKFAGAAGADEISQALDPLLS